MTHPQPLASMLTAPAEQLQTLLTEMALELRGQFDTFRRLRRASEAAALGSDEAAARLARADLKAATEAVALILRSLEKIDQLQRQVMAETEAPDLPDPGYAEARAYFLALLEARAEEIARAMLRPDQAAAPTHPPTGLEPTAGHTLCERSGQAAPPASKTIRNPASPPGGAGLVLPEDAS